MKKLISIVAACAIVLSMTACSNKDEDSGDADEIIKNNYKNATKIELIGEDIFVENDENSGIFKSNDVIYYKDMEEYESGNIYGEGERNERHAAEEAAEVTVVNITKPGSYRLTGQLNNGQIRVDLGEDAKDNPEAKVVLILDNADITCDIAPAILFLNVYECTETRDAENATKDVDTSAAGANIVVEDNSVNNINGSHVAKIFKDTPDQKKLWKQDGAIYSYMSMNIDSGEQGDGIINVKADNEGICSEMHLTLKGGNINIISEDDGMNASEDGVSVITIAGGNTRIIAGVGSEGDGIDSNGWLVVNGGAVVTIANPAADSGMDSDMGSYVNGGTVVALGFTMDWAETDSEQVTMNLQFREHERENETIIVKDLDGNIVFAYGLNENQDMGILSQNTHSFKGAVISSPVFKVGESYELYLGGMIEGESECGIYDVSTITNYSGGVQQGWTSTDVNARDFRENWERNQARENFNKKPFEEMDEEELRERGHDIASGAAGDELKNKVKAEKNLFGKMKELNKDKFEDAVQRPNGEIPKDVNPGGAMQPVPTFMMQDKVNSFSGIFDYTV